MQKDLRVLQIIQKAREFGDTDLLNEELVQSLINSEIMGFDSKNLTFSEDEKEQIATCINELIKAKERAQLS